MIKDTQIAGFAGNFESLIIREAQSYNDTQYSSRILTAYISTLLQEVLLKLALGLIHHETVGHIL